MLIRRVLNGLLATATVALMGACSTPCDGPGRLCAPIDANTSAATTGQRALPLTTPATPPAARTVPEATVETLPVESPGAARQAPVPAAEAMRIGLILPLRSDALGGPAEAVRAGFMAAHERDPAGFTVNVIETADSSDETLDAYMAARKENDLIVGPLARAAVSAVAASGTVTKPTIALNYPEGRSADNPIPPNMLVIGLSIEDEARQVANWAGAEHPKGSAVIVSGTTAWQRRIASAFAQQWKQLGNIAQVVEMPGANGYLQDDGVSQLKTKIDTERPTVMLAALDAEQLRQVRTNIGSELPVYGTSSINPGRETAGAMMELDGVHLLDLPWHVNTDHPAVMQYMRPAARRSLDIDRLYALGIDAYRVAREVAVKKGANFQIDGVTGKLTVRYVQGAPRFERSQPAVIYQGGGFRPADRKK